jgi:hypothetical protein
MLFKKILVRYAIQFIPCLVAGVLLTFAYSMRYHEDPGIDWLVAFGLAMVLDLGVTWLNMRQERRQQKASGPA